MLLSWLSRLLFSSRLLVVSGWVLLICRCGMFRFSEVVLRMVVVVMLVVVVVFSCRWLLLVCSLVLLCSSRLLLFSVVF